MKYSVSTIIITVVAIIIILALAFLLYYYSVTPVPVPNVSTQKVVVTTPQPNKVVATNVITFSPPTALSTDSTSGNCFANSVAEPYRKDAFRCMVQNGIYDPCFTTAKDGFVFCPVDPSKKDSVVIKLTGALPKPSTMATKTGWAWFIKLEDGNYCSPFTGTLPPLKDQMAYYGCSGAEGEVLVGDLVPGKVWTAKEGVAAFDGTNWVLKSQKQVNIDTVWQ